MKHSVLCMAVFMILVAGSAAGQDATVLTNFDHAVRDGLFTTSPSGSQIWDAWTWGNAVTTMWDTAGGVQYEGEGAFKVTWFNYSTNWGWYGNLWFHWDVYPPATGPYIDLSHRDTMKLHYRVLDATPDSGVRKFHLILYLYDGADVQYGGDSRGEMWSAITTARLDSVTSDWQTVSIPLVDLGEMSADSAIGKGFVLADLAANKQLDFAKITGYRLDISTDRGDDETIPDAGGTILFDAWECTGNITRPLDTTPPGATQGLAVNATPSVQFSNTLSWSMTSEPFGIYNAYSHYKPITDLADPDLDVLGIGLDAAVTERDHALYAPNTDQNVTTYYSVVTLDRSRNVGALPASVSRTAMAKGIPTIASGAPTGFFADGDLTDWAGINPTKIYKELGSIVDDGTITDSTDLSAKVYLAMDNTALYVAFDVTDDYVYTGTTDRFDSPVLYLGLYNWHGLPHSGFQRGAQPDYALRFEQDTAWIAHWWDANYPLVATGTEYLFSLKPAPAKGYIVEAKIGFDVLAAQLQDTLFHPVAGMRIPLGIDINDLDVSGGDREGVLANGDDNWSSPANWKFTWIGNTMYVTSVPEGAVVPGTFVLHQNYPNPFNPRTQIAYQIAGTVPVQMTVYDILGRTVATPVNEIQTAGRHVVEFDATRLASGVYFYRLQAGSFTDSRKMMILK